MVKIVLETSGMGNSPGSRAIRLDMVLVVFYQDVFSCAEYLPDQVHFSIGS